MLKLNINSALSALVAATLGTAISAAALAAPVDQDVFTDFEGIAETDFTLGTSPDTAHFIGGFSGVAGILELYNSGSYAWMVNPGDTGTITFETDAATVNFFARTRSIADGNSILTAFDSLDQVIDTLTLTPADDWVEVLFTGAIVKIEFQNLASCNDCMNSIDDFGFSAVVPVPAAAWLFGSGLVGLIGVARRRRRT